MKEFIIVVAVSLLFGAPIVYSVWHNDKIVENYCSIAYQHNVKDYKACKQLTQAELIEKLTKDLDKSSAIPELEIIK